MNVKVQCPACQKLVVLLDFSTSDSGLSFRCGACGRESFIKNPQAQNVGGLQVGGIPAEAGIQFSKEVLDPSQAARRLRGGDVFTTQSRSVEIICPKCGHCQNDPVACHRCGLTFAKYNPGVLPPDPETAVAAWEQVQLSPLSDEAHEAFLQACLTADRLDFGARQYRLMARDPIKREKAEKMIARLYQVGQARLGAHADLTVSKERPTKLAKVVRWILVLAAAGLFSYFIMNLTDLLSKL
jgi:predicted RNA-binding Zn-ribbon protein involved in translation (DUF1610 family)